MDEKSPSNRPLLGGFSFVRLTFWFRFFHACKYFKAFGLGEFKAQKGKTPQTFEMNTLKL